MLSSLSRSLGVTVWAEEIPDHVTSLSIVLPPRASTLSLVPFSALPLYPDGKPKGDDDDDDDDDDDGGNEKAKAKEKTGKDAKRKNAPHFIGAAQSSAGGKKEGNSEGGDDGDEDGNADEEGEDETDSTLEALYYKQVLSERFVVRVSSSLALHALADNQAVNQANGACVI